MPIHTAPILLHSSATAVMSLPARDGTDNRVCEVKRKRERKREGERKIETDRHTEREIEIEKSRPPCKFVDRNAPRNDEIE
jgi:hypothetical protein